MSNKGWYTVVKKKDTFTLTCSKMVLTVNFLQQETKNESKIYAGLMKYISVKVYLNLFNRSAARGGLTHRALLMCAVRAPRFPHNFF